MAFLCQIWSGFLARKGFFQMNLPYFSRYWKVWLAFDGWKLSGLFFYNSIFLYLTLNWFKTFFICNIFFHNICSTKNLTTALVKIFCGAVFMTSKSVLLFYKLMSVDFFSQWCICTFKNQWVLIILYLFRRICTFLAGSHTVHCTFNGQFWHFSGGERHSQICRQRYNPCRWMGKCLFTGKNTVFPYIMSGDIN